MSSSPIYSAVSNQTYHGLSAIPIDDQTFQLVKLTPPTVPSHSIIGLSSFTAATSSFTVSPLIDPVESTLFSEPFLSVLSSLSSNQLPTDVSLSVSTTFGSSTDSSISECRPLPELLPMVSDHLSPKITSSPISSSAINPLSTIPYFNVLSQVLDADLEFKNATCPAKPNISAMEKELCEQLSRLEQTHPKLIYNLRTFYKCNVSNIELERFQSLQNGYLDPLYANVINNDFDEQIVQIITRVTQSVDLLRSLPRHLEQFITPQESTTISDNLSSGTQLEVTNSGYISLHASTRVETANIIPAYQSVETTFSTSTPSKQQNSAHINHSNSGAYNVFNVISQNSKKHLFPCNMSPVVKARTPLSKQTINILETWYSQHIDHPYPCPQVTDELAQSSGISTGQVRKWLANKRSRSKNTKSLSAIACRKRLEKYGNLM